MEEGGRHPKGWINGMPITFLWGGKETGSLG